MTIGLFSWFDLAILITYTLWASACFIGGLYWRREAWLYRTGRKSAPSAS